METSLHRQLKEQFAVDASRREVVLGSYRIDALQEDGLVEIQYGSLGAIRDKIRCLLAEHDVLVVKPLSARKVIVRRSRTGGAVESMRVSPQKESVYSLFLDLVHFVTVFPHPRLTLQVLLTEQEEHRITAPRRRWRSKGYRVEDRRLLSIVARHDFRSADDVGALLPAGLPNPFSTADIAREAAIPRWLAQKMAYCLRQIGVIELAGKSGNSLQYSRVKSAAKSTSRKNRRKRPA